LPSVALQVHLRDVDTLRRPAKPAFSFSAFLIKAIERILFALVSYAILAFLSFSFFTGRFPPKKEDFSRSVRLLQKMYFDAKLAKSQSKEIGEIQDAGQSPSLEQIAEFQRLSLRRTEVAMELLSIFKQLNLNSHASSEMESKLNQISLQLTAAEKGLGEITTHLQATTKTQ
jgi:hypothetical protein